jgi:type II secretory pathway pseudopilin PulG
MPSARCQVPDFNMFRRPQSPSLKRNRRRSEGGYILLTFLLVITILAIFAAAADFSLTQQIKRDREEELVHRGVQYSRAIRHYYKKLGRYPTRIEDIESTNSIRFLRKRYKDPITGKDFKLLHQGEVQMSFAGGVGGAAGLQGGGAALQALAAQAGLSGQNGQNSQAMAAGMAAAVAAAQPTGQVNVNPTDTDSSDQDPNAKAAGQTGGPGTSPGSPIGSGPTFGGGAIVGVVSTSKLESIRSFNKKDHYNQWQFIYDPTSDRGGLLMTPNQPPLNINNNNSNGQPGQPGTGQPGMGQPGSGINGGSGFGNQPTSPGNPPTQQPAQPDSPQQ